jgi:ubiquinone/menaquinone biosynthesis C-methylase UbiE
MKCLTCNQYCFEFIEEPEKAIAEALRVLKKGGRLVVGMIHKEGYWGKKYLQKGLEHPDSVFAHAQFYSEQTTASWSTNHLASLNYGLYITPENFESEKQALDLEKELSQINAKNQACYIIAKWIK